MKSTQHDLNTNPNDRITSKSVKKLHIQTTQLFLEQTHLQNVIFQIHKILSHLSWHAHYSLKQHSTIDTVGNYDPIKQYY